MNVLMAIGNPDFTGASRMAWGVARAIKAAGHRIIVVGGKRPPADQSSVYDALRADGIDIIEEVGFDRKIPSWRLISRISSIVHEEKIECMVALMQIDFKTLPYVAKRTSVKFVYYVQNLAKFSGGLIIEGIKRYTYKNLLRKYTAKLVCCSDTLRIQHIKEFGVDPSRAEVVYNAVDRSRFAPILPEERIAIREQFGVSNDELLILNVGRLSLQKGQDLLLRSLAAADMAGRSFKLVLVGDATLGKPDDDAYIVSLHQLAERPELAGRVVFAGWRNDIPKILRSADIYVHGANWEGLPLAVLEAMAAALPSVSTDCSVPTGFISGFHGHVVQTGNAIEFTKAIENLISLKDDERTRIGNNAEELIAKDYDIDFTTRRFVSILESVVEEGVGVGDMQEPQN